MKVAKVIATCFLPKTYVPKTYLVGNPVGYFGHSQKCEKESDVINLIKFSIDEEKKSIPGVSRDLIVVNNDQNSLEYKKWESFVLSSDNKAQILIPPKFGNGHLVLSDSCIFHYKQNTQYNRDGQFTIKWNDPSFNFKWMNNSPILSERDT